ncbi:MAG: biotin/lipoyl-containing protein, partial [Candidatus Rokuibacteriota bacterium]
MRVELRVPSAGESITEVQIADWLKRTGDRVRQDEPVVLLETDKAAMELPSPVSGVLTEVVKQKGEMAKVGDVLAYLEETPLPDVPTAQPKTDPAAEAPRIMPSARRLLAERKVVSEDVTPTGPGGRLLKEDVLRHLDEAREPAVTAAPAAPAKMAPAPEVGPRTAASREEEAVPMGLLRRRVAERLVKAQQTAALLTTFNEIDMSSV